MKPQHSTFILGMIKHGDKIKAYQTAYPKAKGQSAIKAAERLLRQPVIAAEIQQVAQNIRSSAVIETYKVMQQEHEVRILSVMKKREILNQIATCEMKVGRWVKEDDGYRMVYQDPRPRDIIHAIVTDTKLEDACNRMRDIADTKLSHYDIYIDGRPCDEPTAIPNPDIPTGLIMLPKKKAPHAAGVAVGSHTPRGKINTVSGNKKEQNSTCSVSLPDTRVQEELPIFNAANFSISAAQPHDDYLSLKKEYIVVKQMRCEDDPISESFYKGFVRSRNQKAQPHVYTDEEIKALENERNQQKITTKPFCGKMYFPEKQHISRGDI